MVRAVTNIPEGMSRGPWSTTVMRTHVAPHTIRAPPPLHCTRTRTIPSSFSPLPHVLHKPRFGQTVPVSCRMEGTLHGCCAAACLEPLQLQAVASRRIDCFPRLGFFVVSLVPLPRSRLSEFHTANLGTPILCLLSPVSRRSLTDVLPPGSAV